VLHAPLLTEAADAIERLQRSADRCRKQTAYLGASHTGMKISASGILGRIRDGRYYRELNYGCGVLLQHLEQMASRFYTGDATAVDEFCQLYCLDDARPAALTAPDEVCGANDKAEKELAQLRIDASRYRWLRGDGGAHSVRWPRWTIQHWTGCWNPVQGEEMDAAVDWAMRHDLQSHSD